MTLVNHGVDVIFNASAVPDPASSKVAPLAEINMKTTVECTPIAIDDVL